jgi:hypothetical protein
MSACHNRFDEIGAFNLFDHNFGPKQETQSGDPCREHDHKDGEGKPSV